jgi:hypothetical protein
LSVYWLRSFSRACIASRDSGIWHQRERAPYQQVQSKRCARASVQTMLRTIYCSSRISFWWQLLPSRARVIHGTGSVKYLSFEGGFYGIVGDDGKRYDPLNLPKKFRADGLRVRFTANLTGYMSVHMWGHIVKLVSIERLS